MYFTTCFGQVGHLQVIRSSTYEIPGRELSANDYYKKK